MNTQQLQAEIKEICQTIAQAEGGVSQSVVEKLLNIIERLAGENDAQKIELQKLSDEINRLKGEKGKPVIKPSKNISGNISSEDERKKAEANAENANGETDADADGKKKRRREPKLPNIKIDREQICPLDKSGLPDDLVFKGYEDVVIQDIIIRTDNVKYRREVYYSPSQNTSHLGDLPDEVRGQGEFGVGIRTLIPFFKIECNMSEKRIWGFFNNFGINISAAYISQQWTGGYDLFHQEKSDIYRSGIMHSDYAQIDDTGARVNGVNQYCQIVCSPLFTAYFTTPSKDRLTVLGVLTDSTQLHYLYNPQAQTLLDTFKLTDKSCAAIEAQLPFNVVMNETEFKANLACLDTLSARQSVHLSEACAIAYYQQQTEFPVIEILLADDAPQFKLLTRHQALCWVHDGRHYKKLKPFVPTHQRALSDFQSRYWGYYTELLKYKREPTPEKKAVLEKEFDEIFSSSTGYEDLDDRIAKTLAKKAELLLVLDYPQLPLHNNASELEARAQARSRDVSFQTRSTKGTKIKDALMTVNQTAKKLGVSFYDYIHDRITGKFSLPSLANLIAKKVQAVPA